MKEGRRRKVMKIGFCITTIPPVLYHTGEGRAKEELVEVEIPDDKLPQSIKDALDDKIDGMYLSHVIYIKE